jgi:hypothetical protein
VANYKLHYYLRQVSFPFKDLVKLIPTKGNLWNVGCGFGHLVKLLLQKLFAKLRRGGKLFIATVPKESSWRYYLAWLQEWVMVKLLGKTVSKERVINFETEKWLRMSLRQIGFRGIRRYQLSATLFFWHKHVVFVSNR